MVNKCVRDKPGDPFDFMATLLKERSTTANGIQRVVAREILDCDGVPSVEVEIATDKGTFRASVPRGTTKGKFIALEKRDGDDQDRFGGKGVLGACDNVNQQIAPLLIGKDPAAQQEIDQLLQELDATENKVSLGANAVLAVSMAVCRAGAAQKGVPLYRHIADLAGNGELCMPVPAFNVLQGGTDAPGAKLPFLEFLVMPVGAESFKDALEMGCAVYAKIGELIAARSAGEWTRGSSAAEGGGDGGEEGAAEGSGGGEGDDEPQPPIDAGKGVGDEGGFVPVLAGFEQALELLTDAVDAANLGGKVKFALNVAASAMWQDDGGEDGEGKDGEEGGGGEVNDAAGEEGKAADAAEGDDILAELRVARGSYKTSFNDGDEEEVPEGEEADEAKTGEDMIAMYREMLEKFPAVVSMEDPFHSEDFDSFTLFTEELGERLQIVGNEVTLGNVERINNVADRGACNAIVVKINQIGTVTETIQRVKLAQAENWGCVVSHCKGETADAFIADLSVGLVTGQIKAGAPIRLERNAKYNHLLRIEQELAEDSIYAGDRFRMPNTV